MAAGYILYRPTFRMTSALHHVKYKAATRHLVVEVSTSQTMSQSPAESQVTLLYAIAMQIFFYLVNKGGLPQYYTTWLL